MNHVRLQRDVSHPTHYEAPYHWWGPGPAPPAPLTLRGLLENGTVSVEDAAVLWAALAQRRSLTVIGGPSGLGKSTVLHALLAALPHGTHRLYLRGCYETFSFLHDPRFAPANSTLLVNEMSPHLPIYLWGPAVHRALSAAEAGYQILATAHGRSLVEFVASLTGSPLHIPARNVAAIDLVALIEPDVDRGARVTHVWHLSATRDGVAVDQLEPGEPPGGVTADQVAAARAEILALLAQDDRGQ